MNAPAGLSREMCDMIIQTLRQVVGRSLQIVAENYRFDAVAMAPFRG